MISAPLPSCKNDIALLKLAGNGINVAASDIELMCLPVGNDASYSQTECMVAGWGWTSKHFYKGLEVDSDTILLWKSDIRSLTSDKKS